MSTAINSPPGEVLRTVTVQANIAAPGITIPANFVGVSMEVGDLITYGMFQGTTGANGSMAGVLRLLGSTGNFRVGGVSSDHYGMPGPPALTQQIANNLNSFISSLGAGWTTIYGLDSFANDAALAATHAGYIANAIGTTNLVFQFGNEPTDNGNFTTSTYPTMWNAYYSAVKAAVPAAKVGAWDAIDFLSTSSVIGNLTPGLAGLSFVSQHWYGIYNRAIPMTIERLLSSVGRQRIFDSGGFSFFRNDAWAKSANIPLRLTESNTIAQHGYAGVSDRLASAAWYLNMAFTFAPRGWTGIDIHSGFQYYNGIYNVAVQSPDSNWTAAPIFYGMMLMSRVQGQQIVPVQFNGAANVNALATLGVNGNANILVVNNDTKHAILVTPDQSSAWSTASVLLMRDGDGNGGLASVVTIGGQTIGASGVWSGAPVTINSGGYVSIPPCGAALIQIQP